MTVEDLLREAEGLPRGEQFRLLEELTPVITESSGIEEPATALRGVGRGLWDGTDAQEYVNYERASWGG